MTVQGNPCLGNCTRYFTHAHAAYHECEVDDEGNRELCSPQEVDDSVKMKFIASILHFEDHLFFPAAKNSCHDALLRRRYIFPSYIYSIS